MAAQHILIPIHDFNSGGTEAIAFRLAGLWLERGCRVSVLAGDSAGSMRARVPAGADVIVLDPPIARSTLSRLRLGDAMATATREISPDLIFIIGNFHFIVAHALRKALPAVPIVAKISNPLLPAGLPGPIARGPGATILRRYLAPIDAATAMSHGLAAEFATLVPGIPVHVIADPNVPDAVRIPAMRDRRLAKGPIELLLVGRFEPQKDIALALRTLAELRKHGAARLTILGEGRLRQRMEALARSLGLTGAVEMPGFSDDVPGALARADVLLISSRFEGVPGIAAEALAGALPIVSTDCSHFLRETVTDPRLGRLVAERSPEALAAAILAQMKEPPAPDELLQRATAPSRFARAAEAYLDVFARIRSSRSA